MIKDIKFWKGFEKDETRNEKLTYHQALGIFEALWQEGLSLGVLPLADPLEEIDTDIRLARILNSCSKNS